MYVTKRKGFAMIMAIFIVVLVALGGVMLLSKGSAGTKSGSKRYIHTQEELLAKSAKEYAILQIQGFDTTAAGDCLNQLSINVNDAAGNAMYTVDVSMLYAFNGPAPAGNCNFLAQNTGKRTTVLLDIVVTDQNITDESIRYHERSWQVF